MFVCNMYIYVISVCMKSSYIIFNLLMYEPPFSISITLLFAIEENLDKKSYLLLRKLENRTLTKNSIINYGDGCNYNRSLKLIFV
jgi:hypothetical protein